MSAFDLIMATGLGLSALVMVIQMTRSVLFVGWLVLWFAAFCAWVLISPWPLSVVTS